jgi:CheY-like chemotaxis protein
MAHVLVVDDVAVVSTAVSIILTRAGHTVETAANGREALSIVGRRAPDAVITDLWMPDLDGLGLIKALRADFPDVAIVAMSGGSRLYSEESSLNRARDAGVTQLLMKPFDTADLLKTIANALEGRPAPIAIQTAR